MVWSLFCTVQTLLRSLFCKVHTLLRRLLASADVGSPYTSLGLNSIASWVGVVGIIQMVGWVGFVIELIMNGLGWIQIGFQPTSRLTLTLTLVSLMERTKFRP